MKKTEQPIEILAPVGNAPMLSAAVFSGADAVYLGLTAFNARRSAGNFTPEQLCEAVCFCHARGVKVHVTLNTTLYTSELPAAAEAVRQIATAGADAVIVQDLAAAELVRRIAPGLALHASTQMSVHTLEGVRQLAKMGFTRAILARELSLEEIRQIAQSSPIETEVFVHGALCMSTSGQCYMSAFLGGRSGNRGSCAGPCRLPFDAGRVPPGTPGKSCHLSLKDNSVIASLPALQKAGVVSAKIEGRLRPPEYVAAAVNACLLAREGLPYDAQLLQDVFSRSGFTQGYLQGRRDRQLFGVRTPEDSALTKTALPRLRELYRRERERVPVDMTLELEAEGAKLTVSDGSAAVHAYSEEEPRIAFNDPSEILQRQLRKTGGTPFTVRRLDVKMQEGLWYLPSFAVNALRRTALENLLQRRSRPRPLPCTDYAVPAFLPHAAGQAQPLAARFAGWQQAEPSIEMLAGIILPIEQADSVPAPFRSRTLLELPRAQFGAKEDDVRRRVAVTARQGFAGYLAHNLAHFSLCEGLPLYGGFGLNVTNALAARRYAELGARGLTLLPELTVEELGRIAPGVPTAALAYGHMPLMLTRACPLQNVTDCARCLKSGQLTDRKAKRFAVRCDGAMRTIYNPIPLYMGDRTAELPVDYLLAQFEGESPEQARDILERLKNHQPFEGEFTRGLYYKGTA